MKYPIGIQSFESLRNDGYLYVDKTQLIYELLNTGKYFFLSRPRRFGKSLLLSTIRAYYEGKRHLFEGLAIDRLTDKWDPRPVLRLDLNGTDYSEPDSLEVRLSGWIEDMGKENGVETSEASRPLSERFRKLLEDIHRINGKQAVILIDEYDKPLVDNIGNPELAERFRKTLKGFYGNLKSMDDHIHFAMLTGVARFSKVSIFSDLNNLNDISFTNQFSAICGISQRELDSYFQEGVAQLSVELNITEGETRALLKDNYDGYRFAEAGEEIYNPFSLLKVMFSLQLGSYWFETGTPTYLIELLQQQHFKLSNLAPAKIEKAKLTDNGLLSNEPIPILYQTGYLTIKDSEPRFGKFVLDYPNREVKQGFIQALLPFYYSTKKGSTEFDIENFTVDVEEGRADDFMRRMSAMVASVPYAEKGAPPEAHFQNVVYLLFTLMGLYVQAEQRTSNGRIDATVVTDRYVYIFEFKTGKTAQEALRQIGEKRYWERFNASGKEIVLIGVGFNPETRSIDGYEISVL